MFTMGALGTCQIQLALIVYDIDLAAGWYQGLGRARLAKVQLLVNLVEVGFAVAIGVIGYMNNVGGYK
ncbi:hypothetical protein [Microbulbifer sp. JMSA003]|uniref:hypothetical protein n=1 Tax=Microbulbifer sp. JMSA003 TaxID=3243369 RepID=UPI00403A4FEA